MGILEHSRAFLNGDLVAWWLGGLVGGWVAWWVAGGLGGWVAGCIF